MTEGTAANALARLPLFAGLDDAELRRLEEVARRRSFPARTAVFTVEQPGEVVYLLLEGTVKIYVEKEDGHELILALLGAGDVVGEMSLVDSAGRSANVVTLEPCSCLWLDRGAFREALRGSAQLAYNLLQLLTSRLRMANEQILSLATLNVNARVARQILAFADRYGVATATGTVRVPLRLTQSDLAGLVSASRERVNHAMVWLKQSGCIAVDRRLRITVLDRQALASRCH